MSVAKAKGVEFIDAEVVSLQSEIHLNPKDSLQKITKQVISYEKRVFYSETGFGDITAIVGANGAGKSTLIKIICGYHTKYDGEIFIEGELVKFSSPIDAYNKGIQTVHQIINQGIIQNMTVAENLVLKDLLTNRKNFLIKKKNYIEEAEKIADLMGIEHSILNKEVSYTSQSERQLIIIARALKSNPKLLILDEPTAAISEKETEILFEKLKGLKEKNVTILYVSHRLHEIERIADKLIVIRDGKISDIMEKPIKVGEIVTAMIGSVPKTIKAKSKENINKEPLIETKDLVFIKNGYPLNLKLYKGEITAIAGLIGAGKSEFGETLFSIRKPISGEIFINGKKSEYKKIKDAVDNGIHLIPEDRSNNAIFPNFDISENITIPFLKKFSPKLIMKRKLEVGINKVIEATEKKLTKKDTIIDKKVLKKVKNNSTMDIDVFVVVKELISTQKEIEIEKELVLIYGGFARLLLLLLTVSYLITITGVGLTNLLVFHAVSRQLSDWDNM